MNIVHIPEKKLIRQVPSCIEELSTKQYIRFVGLLLQLENNSISFESFKMKFSVELLSLKIDLPFCFHSGAFKEKGLQ